MSSPYSFYFWSNLLYSREQSNSSLHVRSIPLFLWGLRPSHRIFKEPVGLYPINPFSTPFSTHICTLPDFFHTLEQADIEKHAGWYAGTFDLTMTRCAIHTATFSSDQPSHQKGQDPLFNRLPSTTSSSECASAWWFCQLRLLREMNGGRGTLITPRSLHLRKSIQNPVVH